MREISIETILSALISEYGRRDWLPDRDPLATLVKTILSQNTSDTNSLRAFESLIAAFPGWEGVAAADVRQIAASIRSGGLADIKSERIKRTLGEIQRSRGRLELDFLEALPLDEARGWLKQLPGVGTKTASCVLLFSLGQPALPVDTHVFRVSKRLGLIDSRTSVEQAHIRLQSLVPPERVYEFHVLMIEHGRRVCKAQRPRCPGCLLGEDCPSYNGFTARV